MRLELMIPLAGGLVLAQTSPAPLRRLAPAAEPIPTPDKYPFTEMISALDGPSAQRTQAPSPPGSMPAPTKGLWLPPDFQPEKDQPLSPSAREALKVTEAWMAARSNSPTEGKDGRVVYTFGAGLPTVVCAPLRVCVVEFQAGEKIVGEPHIGDSVRWMVSPASAGNAPQSIPMVVLKPKSPGLDTNLLVTTDRRAYYLRLVSKPEEYLARVAFSYPEDDEGRWRAHLAREQEQRKQQEIEVTRITPVESLENLYFDYRITGGNESMRPVRVVDDGKKTYIQMATEAAHRELPALAVLGADGKAELVNFRVKGQMYIVDRLFDRAALILGAGRKAQKTEIIRGSYRGKKVKGDPFVSVVPADGSAAATEGEPR